MKQEKIEDIREKMRKMRERTASIKHRVGKMSVMFIYIRGCMNQRSCDYATLSFDFIISTTFLNFTKVFTKNSDFAFKGRFTTQRI